MPNIDRHHAVVVRALQKDGWEITDEQVTILQSDRKLYIDIEATKADKNLVILVEVKELYDVPSHVEALANALGKYQLYSFALRDGNIDKPLFMAVTEGAYYGILSEKLGRFAIEQGHIALIVFNPDREEIVQWIP